MILLARTGVRIHRGSHALGIGAYRLPAENGGNRRTGPFKSGRSPGYPGRGIPPSGTRPWPEGGFPPFKVDPIWTNLPGVIELALTEDVNRTRHGAAVSADTGEPTMNETTWDELLPAYRDSLVRFAESYAHRSCEAEDVVQDVFVRIMRNASGPTFDRPGAYLRRAVANECVSHWRRSSRERLRDELPERVAGDHADDVVNRVVVRNAVATLPERMRQVVTLSFLEGMSDAAVAVSLGIAEITVRTTRKRALAHLRLQLADIGAVATAPALAPVAVAATVTEIPADRTPELVGTLAA